MNEMNVVCRNGVVTRASGHGERPKRVPPHPVVASEHALFILAGYKEEPTTPPCNKADTHGLAADRKQTVCAGFKIRVAFVIAWKGHASDGEGAQFVAQIKRKKSAGAVKRPDITPRPIWRSDIGELAFRLTAFRSHERP